jgi:tetratricopeptide (TPR) repeat protein/tRNA A-37 threonylcarbamoyl transferase component Bud32
LAIVYSSVHINFRYHIVRFITSGATGNVYLVEDLLDHGELRALKTIRTDRMNAESIKTIRNEFSLLRQFRHPCIVQAYECGEVLASDVPELLNQMFLTLEYVEGAGLFEATRERRWDEIAQIVFQCAHALDYIHRHGLIHFDVKPSNILVIEEKNAPGGFPLAKIIDFGLAAHAIESLDNPVRGTVEYMAPELTGGAPYDHRVDLYSLGVTLYEIIARRLPIRGKDSLETLKKHQSETPEGIDSVVPDTPQEIVTVVMTLLQKDPNERFARAREIGQRVKPLLRDHARLERMVAAIPSVKFFGRSAEISAVLNTLQHRVLYHENQIYPEPASFVCIVGEKGIGKTALLSECTRRAQAEGMSVLSVQCAAGLEASLGSLQRLIDELRFAVRVHPAGKGTPAAGLEEYYAKNLEWFFNAGAPTRLSQIRSAEKRRSLHTRMAEFLAQASRIQPFIISIDDLHRADKWSIELLALLGRKTIDAHWTIVTASGSAETYGAILPPAREKIDFLYLAGLGEEALTDVLKMELEESGIPAGLVQSVIAALGDSPCIVKEWLGFLRGTLPHVTLEAIGKAAGDIGATKRVSPKVDELYRSRWRELPKNGKRIVELLSCSGEPLEIRLLQKILSSPFSKPDIDSLIRGGSVTYVHERGALVIGPLHYRLSVYSSLGARKKALHKKIAEGLLRVHRGEAEQWPGRIAEHFKLAGVKEKALKFYEQAAAYAARQDKMQESIRYLEEARQLASDKRRATAIARQLAGKYDLIEQYEKAEKLYRGLLSERGAGEKNTYRDLIALGTIQMHRGAFEESRDNFERALKITATIDQKLEVEEKIIDIAVARGEFKEAKDRAHKIIGNIPDPKKYSRMSALYTKLGIVHFYEANYEASAHNFLQAYEILKNEKDRSTLIAPLLNIGNVCSAQGKYAEAIDYWKRALRHAKAVGNVHEQAQILNNLGIAEYSQGHYETAESNYLKGIALFTELQHRPGIMLCTSNLGEVFLVQALYEKAIAGWKQCLSFYEEIKDLQGLIETHNHLCQATLALGDGEAAQSHHAHAGQLLEQEDIEVQRGIYYFCAGLLSFSAREYNSAEESIKKGETIFTAIGEHAYRCRCRLHLSRIFRAAQRFDAIRLLLAEAIEIAAKHGLPLLQAEGLYELGRQARTDPRADDAPAISYFKEAFALIEHDTVSELAWQVCLETGKEYIGRGLESKGKAMVQKSKAILEYLGAQCSEDSLKTRFWAFQGRSGSLEEMRSLLGD